MLYQVTGEIACTEYCDCPHCDGHRKHKSINTTIQAKSKEDAAEQVLYKTLKDYDDGKWAGEPVVIELGEDVLMRLIGAPVLPGFEAIAQ